MNPAFDIAAFQTAFPQFATTPSDTIQGWVTLVINSPMGGWFECETGLTNQQLMVAHIGYLFSKAATGQAIPGGAMVSAAEGSVNAAFAAPPIKTGLQYYLSGSPYGQMLWANLCVAAAGGDYVGGLPERRAFRKVYGTFQ
ncbi:phage protein [Rhizobium freirei PRF 81]|uniref:Phage protein n=1 Tax=Rhizobium freirei PRF 81 TaxID=363754 RepID=N6U764_9HYPH|nr:DUF4054 domain-containing protein [Rhizobium freirei]ENN86068.1 phage protein [Rhizobium freirei PRF 81]